MEELRRTLKGLAVGRRCDMCGRRVVISIDTGEHCLLTCANCGREYRFFGEDRGFSNSSSRAGEQVSGQSS